MSLTFHERLGVIYLAGGEQHSIEEKKDEWVLDLCVLHINVAQLDTFKASLLVFNKTVTEIIAYRAKYFYDGNTFTPQEIISIRIETTTSDKLDGL